VGPTSAAIASVEEIGRPVAVREADACRGFQEEEVGKSVP
jgi:hypothetical protein